MRSIIKYAVSGVSLLALTAPAFAQEAAEEEEEEIVVTGTLVRGIAPPGTSVVDVSAADIQASSATTITELLTDVPQFSSFNDLQTLSGGGNFVTTNRPNLRNLPGFTTTGTSATLLMIDGHRVVGMGVSSTTPDADFVAPGILERVDIIPDGGSALYGSDAVAGVVNFITRKRFDGVKVDARYGFGKEYYTFDANATIGKEWDTGSLWVSYSYSKNDDILGSERDYVFTPQSLSSGVTIRDLECAQPNVLVSGISVPAFGLNAPPATLRATPLSANGAGTANTCDNSDGASIYPKQERHSVYAGLNQQLNDWLEVDVRGFYYRKEQLFNQGQLSGSVTVTSAGTLAGFGLAQFGFASSPFYVPQTTYIAETQAVNFALGPNVANFQRVTIDAWGFNTNFTADLGGGWRMRTLAGFSESASEQHSPRLIPTAQLAALVISGAFNPYAPTTASAATAAALSNRETYGRADQSQFNIRTIIDGDLFELPGGALKLAAGAEYLEETYVSRKGDTVPANFTSLPRFNQKRNVKSVFGELVAPVFGGDGGPSLTLSAAGRYDDYNDFGGTFNPKFGATFKPVDWVSIRGAWGESFVAPSLADSSVADPVNVNFASGATVNFLLPPALLTRFNLPQIGASQQVLFVLGAKPGLEPVTGKTWSIGADIDPPFIPGLKLSGTYYDLTYENIISLVPFVGTGAETLLQNFLGTAFITNPTQAQINTILGQASSVVGAPCTPLPTCIYAIEDVRKQNLGGFKQTGIDFAVNYNTETGFGGLDFGVSGNKILTQTTSPFRGRAYVKDAPGTRFRLRASMGADIGEFRAQATFNHTAGYNLNFPVGLVAQNSVGSYNTVDFFFKYDFADTLVGKELALTVTVNNAFDQDPPVFFGGNIVRAQRGFINGNSVGRLVQVGLSTKF